MKSHQSPYIGIFMKTFLLLFTALIVQQGLAQEALLQEKLGCRRDIMKMSEKFQPADVLKSAMKQNDRAENLVDDPAKMIFSLKDMEEKNLNVKSLETKPWSDSYWPIYAGMLGQRYNDLEMRFSEFKDYLAYYENNPVEKLIANKAFDILAPSEKYDFILGFKNKELTERNWAEGKYYQDNSGKVESWMGLCHGWAAAAIILPEPKKTLNIEVDGNNVPLFVSDIKAYGTLLYANGEFETRFIGGRCNTKSPKLDNIERPIEPDCLDNNPGTWHLAVVNQLGVFNRSMVIDATYDYQVWNQPLASYSYGYFNVKNKKPTKLLESAVVKVSEWSKDPYKKVRSPKAEYIVGIEMAIEYVRENSPNRDENQEVFTQEVVYEYDLELDKDYKIIGGEWRTLNHPDFLWVPAIGAFPVNAGEVDRELNLNAISAEHREEALELSKDNMPLGSFVRALFY